MPVVLKEVGSGISETTAAKRRAAGRRRRDRGHRRDVLGAHREPPDRGSGPARHGELFSRWGVPTAESVEICRRLLPAEAVVIASGGSATASRLRRRCALGADAAAVALPVLKAAARSIEDAVRALRLLVTELRTAMFLTGCRSVTGLRSRRLDAGARPHRRAREPRTSAEAIAPAGERHDAIVIGAGIAGLVAASELAERGHRVLVLELNHQAGGLMAGITRRGFHFDVGCQSFEDMGIVFPLLESYGLSDLARFRRARYRLVMPGLDAVVESLPQIRGAFQARLPRERPGAGPGLRLPRAHLEARPAALRPGRGAVRARGGPTSLTRWALRALAPGAAPPLGDLRTLLLEDAERWYERELPPSGVRDLLPAAATRA